ncbi:hypothetical protein HK105_208487 [Polyrhizophydium stewartii]|uniref:SET domain-containing protein n=1 Tax=Polyrhizophydium stewartii TaxID=2732419 RepID=A0ABR4MXN9_9FUNG
MTATASDVCADMLRWASSRGCAVHPGVAVAESPDKGMGLFAADALSGSDTVLLSVPHPLMLSKTLALAESKDSPGLRAAIEQLQAVYEAPQPEASPAGPPPESMYIRVLLLWLRLQPSERWAPYMRLFPKRFLTPLLASDRELEALDATHVDDAVRAKRRSLEGDYARLAPVWSAMAAAAASEPPTLEDFMWSNGAVWSRAMSAASAAEAAPPPQGKTAPAGGWTDDLVIVPLIDFANHSPTPNAYWCLTERGMELRLKEPLAEGDEIFISYGDKPNEELLFTHGFIVPGNSNRVVVFKVPVETIAAIGPPVPSEEARLAHASASELLAQMRAAQTESGDNEDDGNDDVVDDDDKPDDEKIEDLEKAMLMTDRMYLLNQLGLKQLIRMTVNDDMSPPFAKLDQDPAKDWRLVNAAPDLISYDDLLALHIAALTRADKFKVYEDDDVSVFVIGNAHITDPTRNTIAASLRGLGHYTALSLRMWMTLFREVQEKLNVLLSLDMQQMAADMGNSAMIQLLLDFRTDYVSKVSDTCMYLGNVVEAYLQMPEIQENMVEYGLVMDRSGDEAEGEADDDAATDGIVSERLASLGVSDASRE